MSSTNNVAANQLRFGNNYVENANSAPSSGQVYTFTSSGVGDWRTPVSADSSTSFTNKTIVSSTNNVAANQLRFGNNYVTVTNSPSGSGQFLGTTSANTAEWTTVSGGSPGLLPRDSRIVYVMKGGDDSSGDGSFLKPYRTILQALQSIRDAEAENKYAIVVGPGTFVEEDTITCKPWVWIIGTQRTATRISSTKNLVAIDSAFESGEQRFGILNCVVDSSTNLEFNLQSLGGSGRVTFESDCLYATNVTFRGRSADDFVEMINSQIVSDLLLYGVSGQVRGCSIGSLTLSNEGGSIVDMILSDNDVSKTVLIEQTTGGTFDVLLDNNKVEDSLTINAVDIINAKIDATSIPASFTITGRVNITYRTPAFGVGYTPSTPSRWAQTPKTVYEAIERLSAALFLVNGGVPI